MKNKYKKTAKIVLVGFVSFSFVFRSVSSPAEDLPEYTISQDIVEKTLATHTVSLKRLITDAEKNLQKVNKLIETQKTEGSAEEPINKANQLNEAPKTEVKEKAVTPEVKTKPQVEKVSKKETSEKQRRKELSSRQRAEEKAAKKAKRDTDKAMAQKAKEKAAAEKRRQAEDQKKTRVQETKSTKDKPSSAKLALNRLQELASNNRSMLLNSSNNRQKSSSELQNDIYRLNLQRAARERQEELKARRLEHERSITEAARHSVSDGSQG